MMRLGKACQAWLVLSQLLVLSEVAQASSPEYGRAKQHLLAEIEPDNQGTLLPSRAEPLTESQISRTTASALGAAPPEASGWSRNATSLTSSAAQAPAPSSSAASAKSTSSQVPGAARNSTAQLKTASGNSSSANPSTTLTAAALQENGTQLPGHTAAAAVSDHQRAIDPESTEPEASAHEEGGRKRGHRKKHAAGSNSLTTPKGRIPSRQLPSNAATSQSHSHTIQDEIQAAGTAQGMPQVELPKGLSEDIKRKEAAAAAAAGADSSFHDADHSHTEDASSAEAVQEHEKGYGAKLPPSVVEFEDEADSKSSQQQQLPDDKEVQYETPHEANVVPGAVFHEEEGKGGRVKAMAQTMGSAMRSATSASVVSSVAVVGAIGVLIGISVYYLRYMRSSPLQMPSIIEVGRSIRAPRYSKLRKQPDSNWEGDWDNDNWDDPGTGRIGDQKHGSKWDEEF